MKDSFIIYKSWAEMMKKMPDKELAELARAISCYQTEDDYTINNPIVKAVFEMFRSQFEKDAAKYEEVCRKRSEAAKGNKSKQVQTNVNKSKQKQPDMKCNDMKCNDNDMNIKKKATKINKFNSFDQRIYDYTELERRLLGK